METVPNCASAVGTPKHIPNSTSAVGAPKHIPNSASAVGTPKHQHYACQDEVFCLGIIVAEISSSSFRVYGMLACLVFIFVCLSLSSWVDQHVFCRLECSHILTYECICHSFLINLYLLAFHVENCD
jgi:hypothetical protein